MHKLFCFAILYISYFYIGTEENIYLFKKRHVLFNVTNTGEYK